MLKYLYIIPFYPLFCMIRIQSEYGWMPLKKWQALLTWFFKLVLIEPFRIAEAMVMAFLPEKKVRPIFIIGFFRSGTTYLQELLAADKAHNTLTLFQSVLPELSLLFGWFLVPVFSAITKVFHVSNQFHDLPFSWRFPGEEDVALNAMMALHDYNRIYQYPSRHKMIADSFLFFRDPEDEKRWSAHYKYLVKKLAYMYWNTRLVLKSPPNMGRIGLLQEMFPDAKFIFIHRDPYISIPSTKMIWKLNNVFSFEEYTESDVEDILIEQYQGFYELFKAQSGHTVCTTITFEQLIRDSTATMGYIYKELGLEGWEKAKPGISAIQAKRKKSTILRLDDQIPAFLQKAGYIREIRNELGYYSHQ